MLSGRESKRGSKIWALPNLTLLTLGLLLSGYETMPPGQSKSMANPKTMAKPISDFKSIAGKWEGKGTYNLEISGLEIVRNSKSSITINEDGSYEGIGFLEEDIDQPLIPGGEAKFKGQMTLSNGKIKSKGITTTGPYKGDRATGTYTLSVVEGKRILNFQGMDTRGGRISMKFRPAK